MFSRWATTLMVNGTPLTFVESERKSALRCKSGLANFLQHFRGLRESAFSDEDAAEVGDDQVSVFRIRFLPIIQSTAVSRLGGLQEAHALLQETKHVPRTSISSYKICKTKTIHLNVYLWMHFPFLGKNIRGEVEWTTAK